MKSLVKKTSDKMLFGSEKTPFALRAMLKMLVLSSRGQTNIRTKVKLEPQEIRLLADLFIAGWLNTGYRNPKAFSVQPT